MRALVSGRESSPASPLVMYQTWRDLLFLHWRVDPSLIARTLPSGLRVDTFGGDAFLGLVPFRMCRIRPRFLPPLPWVSWFLETNVRTYVVDIHGRPGVWFYSLDANQPIAVATARRFFHLPYEHASMRFVRTPDGIIRYDVTRRGAPSTETAHFSWRPPVRVAPAAPGSLEFFLVERYRLFAKRPDGRFVSGLVRHEPYEFGIVTDPTHDDVLLRLDGFETMGRPADLAHFSPGVEVKIHGVDLVP